MDIVIYDGSFKGLLTAIFEVYEYKMTQPVIYREGKHPEVCLENSYSALLISKKVKGFGAKLDAEAFKKFNDATL